MAMVQSKVKFLGKLHAFYQSLNLAVVAKLKEKEIESIVV